MNKPRRIVFRANFKSKYLAKKYGKIAWWDEVYWYEVEVAKSFSTKKECFGYLWSLKGSVYDLKYNWIKVEDEYGKYEAYF